MALIPQNDNTTKAKIYAWYESQEGGGHRPHLGASEIGHHCSRYLWYKFRWCFDSNFEGRILKLFRRGHDEEAVFVRELKAIGVEVIDCDDDGNQYDFSEKDNAHFRGSMDGAAKGLPESPGTWHVLEFKTHSDKSFKDLCAKGVQESKPQHFAQMQVYMKWTGMERAMYMAVNKNDDSIYTERIKYEPVTAKQLTEKANQITFSGQPLEGISTRPDWYQCKMCDAYDICHGGKVAKVSCRSCCHSTPQSNGTWLCEKHGHELDNSDQERACEDHLYIPALMPAEMVDGDTNENWVRYKKADGTIFINSSHEAAESYLSHEIEANFAVIGDPKLNMVREGLGAKVAS